MNFELSNALYDKISALVKYILPASGTLYFALAEIWNFPYPEQVVGTIVAITTFLGAVIGLSKSSWEKNPDGDLLIDESDPEKDIFSLQIPTDPNDLKKQDIMRLRIIKTDAPSVEERIDPVA